MSRPFSLRRLLLPLVPAYRLALVLRELGLRLRLEPVRRLKWPVISIGNLSTGGSGKTPLTIALAQALARRGFQVDVLSRGYGRQSQRPARVRPDGTAEEFGDEPLLIARETGVPVYVAGQRYQAGLLAERDAEKLIVLKGHGFSRAEDATKLTRALAPEGRFSGDAPPSLQSFQSPEPEHTFHLLDDGFQHRQLHREVNILLLDRRDWQGDLLPAGNLREPLKAARRASVIAIPASEPDLEAALRAWVWRGSLWWLHRKMEIPAVAGPVAAFCGIARPEQFFLGLEAAGLKLSVRIAFADHHRYSEADLKRLTIASRAAGATALITTEKDRVRLGALAQALPDSLPLVTASLRIEIENEDAAVDLLVERLISSR
jgi:tetraacyldisaccharide 4'-kinase